MKTFSIAFISLISSFLINIQTIKACWWGPEPESLRVWLFNPAVNGHNDLSPFYFNTDSWNAYHIFDWNNIPEENIEEWHAYFNQQIDKEAIRELVYRISTTELLEIKDGKTSTNALSIYLKKNKRNDVLEYLYFAKQVEDLFRPVDEWTQQELDKKKALNFANEAKKKAEKAKDSMMKQRYAYLAVMLFRYAEKFQESIQLYNSVFGTIPANEASVMKYWSLSHIAYAQASTDKKDSQLNFVRTFANCHAKKFWVTQNIENEYIRNLLTELSGDDLLFANLYLAFRTPAKALPTLKEIGTQNANHPLFKSLLVREINKIEDWILTRKYTGGAPAIFYWSGEDGAAELNLKNDLAYTKEVAEFVEKLIADKKVTDVGFWQLVAAHLRFTEGNASKAMDLLNKAEKNLKTNEERTQFFYTRMMIRTIAEKKFDAEFEKLIWADMAEIVKDTTGLSTNRNFSNLMLAFQQAYQNRGFHDRAALFMAYDLKQKERWETRWWDYSTPFFYLDKYANRQQVENFANIANSKTKSPLEAFLLADFETDSNRLIDLMGTMELRNGNLADALKYYQKIPKNFWSENYDYTIYLDKNLFHNYKVYFRQDAPERNTDFFNKAILVQTLMSEIEFYKAEKDTKKKAERAFWLGNAYYNLSYFGKHWYAVCYGKSVYGNSVIYTEHNSEVNANYKTCSEALKYYEEAIKLHSDVEKKAEITFLCAGIKHEVDTYFDSMQYWEEGTQKPVIQNIYAQNLKKNYPEQYAEFRTECSMLKDFGTK